LPDLDKGPESYYAIYNLLAKLGAVPTKAFIDAGSSNARVGYELPNGRTVFFKQIRPARLAETCDDCAFNNGADCKEGFYGVRLYRDKEGVYRVGVCIQRMDLTSPIEEFMRSNLYNEVQEMRLRDLADLQSFYSERK
jgi:cyclic pyranopterin phosphate synthase